MSLKVRDDRFDLLGIHQVVGQMVVDLGVGEEAALLAQRDQVLQARAACFEIERLRLAARAATSFSLSAAFADAAQLDCAAGAAGRRAGPEQSQLRPHGAPQAAAVAVLAALDR